MEIQFREVERRLAASKLFTRQIAKRVLSRPGLALGASREGSALIGWTDRTGGRAWQGAAGLTGPVGGRGLKWTDALRTDRTESEDSGSAGEICTRQIQIVPTTFRLACHGAASPFRHGKQWNAMESAGKQWKGRD